MSSARAPSPSMLSEPAFARWFIGGVPLVGLCVASLIALRPSWWAVAVWADLWLLSFPHVASTFSRTAFRGTDREEHRWMLWLLPLIALATCALTAATVGIGVLNGAYFFWQTFHYVRQGRGMYRAVRHGNGRPPDDRLADATMYLVALWALTHRLAQHPATFLGVPVTLPRIHWQIELWCCIAATVSFLLFVLRMARDARSKPQSFDAASSLYVVTQVVLFVTSYVVIDNPSIGWLAVNIWHNAQYLLFVYAWNNRRFAAESATSPGSVQWLARRRLAFYAVFAALGAAMYSAAALVADVSFLIGGITVTYLVLVQSINMHHYIADMVLWRAPKRAALASQSDGARRT